MSSESTRAWGARRKTTNLLLGTNIVVLAAGFVAVGNVGTPTRQELAELILVLVFFTAVALVAAKRHGHGQNS